MRACGGQATADVTDYDAASIQTDKGNENMVGAPAPNYDERKKGWYWYETEPELEEEEKTEADKPELTVSDRSYEELWNMYPDDFQDLLDRTTKIAVQSPSEKNVLQYLVMQDIARRKSVAFANVVGYVGQKYPRFSNADVHPVIPPGRTALAELKHGEVKQTIEESSNEFALIMFTQRDCKFCDIQKSILKFFTASYDWAVRLIDIDRHPNLSSRFGIEQTPSIILVHKNSQDYMPISVGVISLRDLNARIYRSIKFLRGEVTPEQWFIYEFEKNAGSDPLKFITLRNQ
ncbi:MAG: conjugal transfer protein TraF [Desulfobacterales bacterium]|nr:conjugal transfer protein TraF [Desulfobacterales bacterium]